MVLIIQSRLSTAQASSSFKWLNKHTSTSTTPTFITEVLLLSYITTAVLNDCYCKVTAYTALAYLYWVSFHDTYGCLCHAH